MARTGRTWWTSWGIKKFFVNKSIPGRIVAAMAGGEQGFGYGYLAGLCSCSYWLSSQMAWPLMFTPTLTMLWQNWGSERLGWLSCHKARGPWICLWFSWVVLNCTWKRAPFVQIHKQSTCLTTWLQQQHMGHRQNAPIGIEASGLPSVPSVLEDTQHDRWLNPQLPDQREKQVSSRFQNATMHPPRFKGVGAE